MYEMKASVEERVILVGIENETNRNVEACLDELEGLVNTAGGIVVGRVIQSREYVHPTTYVGSGKLDEIKMLINTLDATGIVCDDELSPTQLKSLEDILDTKVMDRTIVILDIFASRATTGEGKVQVELAQLKYSLTRLAGFGRSMSRLGGGIGTRGPGETKLETDRRVIRNRVATLQREIKELEKRRGVTRHLRDKNDMTVIAIVGYTNAGKSTLLNRLTGSSVLSENKLFATLDPTTKSLKLKKGITVLFTDTVGFINKLPHHLVDAFRSTLEEAKYADIVLHVVDASNPDFLLQTDVVYETLDELKIEGKPIITLYNKCDNRNACVGVKDERAVFSMDVSAKSGKGIPEFLDKLSELLEADRVLFEQIIPYALGSDINVIRKNGEVIKEEYLPEGIFVSAYVPQKTDNILAKHIMNYVNQSVKDE